MCHKTNLQTTALRRGFQILKSKITFSKHKKESGSFIYERQFNSKFSNFDFDLCTKSAQGNTVN